MTDACYCVCSAVYISGVVNMANIVKCNACNIVIDELLSYIQNKVSVIDEETLVRLCVSSFTADEIKKSKQLLFDSIPTSLRRISRKKKGKEDRDLADIVNLFKSAEPDGMPVFVARQLEKLPPILFNHLDCTKLLKDILLLKDDIEKVKSTYVTHGQLTDLKSEFLHYRNDSLPPSPVPCVNMKRGACLLNSGSLDLSGLAPAPSVYESPINAEEPVHTEIEKTPQHYRQMVCDGQLPTVFTSGQQQCPVEEIDVQSSLVQQVRPSVHSKSVVRSLCYPASESVLPATSKQHSSSGRRLGQVDIENAEASVHSLVVTKPLEIRSQVKATGAADDEGFQYVCRRKKRIKYRYHGKSGMASDMDCTFKAADKKVPIFITNVHIDTVQDDIVKYIKSKTEDSVSLQRINSTRQKGYVAYKFFVSETKLAMYLDEQLWPRGIIFRRFVNFIDQPSLNRFTSVYGQAKPEYG